MGDHNAKKMYRLYRINATKFSHSQHCEPSPISPYPLLREANIEVTVSSSENHFQRPMKHEQGSHGRLLKSVILDFYS